MLEGSRSLVRGINALQFQGETTQKRNPMFMQEEDGSVATTEAMRQILVTKMVNITALLV
jgi:hypothetical protein